MGTLTKPGGIDSGSAWFDPTVFQALPQGRFGNCAFNTMRGLGLVNWVFGVFREFAFTELAAAVPHGVVQLFPHISF